MGRGKPAHNRGNEFTNLGSGGYLFRARPRNEHVAWRTFLQEQFGSLHHGLGVKPATHRAAVR
jgi:hypothetical protein